MAKKLLPLETRIWNSIEMPDGQDDCWIWTGSLNRGYGRLWVGRDAKPIHVTIHRWTYERFISPIPDSLTLDHRKCRNKRCVNPWHCVPCTRGQNVQEPDGVAGLGRAKTHCPRGHPYSVENTRIWRGFRNCRACDRARGSGWRRHMLAHLNV